MCECSWFYNAIAFANYCYTIVLIVNNVLLVCFFINICCHDGKCPGNVSSMVTLGTTLKKSKIN